MADDRKMASPPAPVVVSERLPDWRVLCEELANYLQGRKDHEIGWPGEDLEQDLLDRVHALLAQPEPEVGRPAPTTAGEVAELVRFLRGWGGEYADEGTEWHRAADLLERQAAPVPVAVTERLPEPSIKVLAHYFNDLGKGRTICAIWVPAKTRSDSYGDDDFTEYDEASDTFYWPEGWYEAIENWDDLGYVKVDEGEVIYWQPLPQWPAHALPLPSGEVEA